jgi:hypothetical protein
MIQMNYHWEIDHSLSANHILFKDLENEPLPETVYAMT